MIQIKEYEADFFTGRNAKGLANLAYTVCAV